jgi:drug/metabolite transporter (DMT)-like permease
MKKLHLLLLVVSSFSAAAGQLLLKVGAHERKHVMEFVNLHILVGLLFYVAGTAIWIYVLGRESLINVYAFTALSFVLVSAFSFIFLGETITLAGAVGILMVLAGLYLVINYN